MWVGLCANIFTVKFNLSLSLSLLKILDLHVLHCFNIVLFVYCEVFDCNCFRILCFFKLKVFAIIICIFVWRIECCCICHQGLICTKADMCWLNLYPCVIKYYFISRSLSVPHSHRLVGTCGRVAGLGNDCVHRSGGHDGECSTRIVPTGQQAHLCSRLQTVWPPWRHTSHREPSHRHLYR